MEKIKSQPKFKFMKNQIVFLFLSLFCSALYSQITYEATYNQTSGGKTYLLGKIKLNQNTTKYLSVNYLETMDNIAYNITYTLYNLNHSVYKTLPIITDKFSDPFGKGIPFSIQENLFNTDENIEIAYFARDNYGRTNFKVIDENGTLLFERDSVESFTSDNYRYNNLYNLQVKGVFNTEDGTKLILIRYYPYGKEIYSLGGTVINNSISNFNADDELISLSPNPSVNYTKITYKLPENENRGEILIFDNQGNEIKRFIVGREFSDLLISTNDLPPGTYIYSLFAGDKLIDNQKSIIIK